MLERVPESLQTLQACAVEGARTLETGCGASTVVFAAQGADHTVISPDGREHRLVREYCRSIGIDDGRVSFIDASSDDVLPSLLTGRELDFAFIDGAHSFPYPVVDFHYIARSLKVGGRILVDDIAIPAVAPAFRFMDQEVNWRLDRIVDDRAALSSLIELPPPEDYVLQTFNRHLDYSFAPLPLRIRISATDHVRRVAVHRVREVPAAAPVVEERFGPVPFLASDSRYALGWRSRRRSSSQRRLRAGRNRLR